MSTHDLIPSLGTPSDHGHGAFPAASWRITTLLIRALVGLCLSVAAALPSLASAASTLQTPADGWVSWQIETIESAPRWCCFDYNAGNSRPVACALDGREVGYSSQNEQGQGEPALVYALLKGGQLQRVRALSASCPVRSESPINALGSVDANLSAAWLTARLRPSARVNEDLIAAIALHAGELAEQTLFGLAEGRDNGSLAPSLEMRKDALFWLGQIRGEQSAPLLERIMREEPNAKLREHAGFSISQSDASNRAAALIRQGREDDSAQVRGQAWFWLGQTADPGTEAAISAALRSERSLKVREKQIFALSQLPDERAASALIGIISDPKQPKALRKHALFWLGQSDSPRAFAYLDALLADQ